MLENSQLVTTELKAFKQSIGTSDRRRRGLHSVKCKNPNPVFNTPESHLVDHAGNRRSRLPIINDCRKILSQKSITDSDGVAYARANGIIKRRFKQISVNAINALADCFVEHVDLLTLQVKVSFTNAAKLTDMITTSDPELEKVRKNPGYVPQSSISRVTRHTDTFVSLGWLDKAPNEQVWDKNGGADGQGGWGDKLYYLTTKFFVDLGITEDRLNKVRAHRLAYVKQQSLITGLNVEEVNQMSFTSLKKVRAQAWRQKYFERRANNQYARKAHRERKHFNNVRVQAQQNVLDAIKGKLMPDHFEFKTMVNKEVARLNRIFEQPQAPPDEY